LREVCESVTLEPISHRCFLPFFPQTLRAVPIPPSEQASSCDGLLAPFSVLCGLRSSPTLQPPTSPTCFSQACTPLSLLSSICLYSISIPLFLLPRLRFLRLKGTPWSRRVPYTTLPCEFHMEGYPSLSEWHLLQQVLSLSHLFFLFCFIMVISII